MGFAPEMKVYCQNECGFCVKFNTSRKVGHSFEVNKRVILAARNIGVGHQGLVKFAATMNMPAPMNKSAYRDSVKTLNTAAKKVAEESMTKAAAETKEFY